MLVFRHLTLAIVLLLTPPPPPLSPLLSTSWIYTIADPSPLLRILPPQSHHPVNLLMARKPTQRVTYGVLSRLYPALFCFSLPSAPSPRCPWRPPSRRQRPVCRPEQLHPVSTSSSLSPCLTAQLLWWSRWRRLFLGSEPPSLLPVPASRQETPAHLLQEPGPSPQPLDQRYSPHPE